MKLFNWIKKIYNYVKNLFHGKNPAEVINKVTKDVVGVATAGIGVLSAINMFRVRVLKPVPASNMAPCDYVAPPRREAVEELFRSKKFKKNQRAATTNKDLEALQVLEKTRNYHFQCLTPDRQLELLKMEGFDFEAYRDEYFREKDHPFYKLKKNIKKFGKIDLSLDKPFREEVDYGFLNFILRPLDRFVHWYKCDPVPLKTKQILVVPREKIPSIKCASQKEYMAAMRSLNLDRIYTDYYDNLIPDKGAYERKRIMMDSFGNTNTLNKYLLKVRKQVMNSKYIIPSGLEILDEVEVSKKKKKSSSKKKDDSGKKKKKAKKDKTDYDAAGNAAVMEMVNKIKKKVEKGEYVY